MGDRKASRGGEHPCEYTVEAQEAIGAEIHDRV